MASDVFPYEQLLGKEGFVAALKQRSLTDEQIVIEWERLKMIFNIQFAQDYFETLSVDEQTQIKGDLNPDSSDDDSLALYKKFVDRIKLENNHGLVLDLAKKGAKIAIDTYKDNFSKADKDESSN